ncbi:MAG TPA: hypothetical protein VN950_00400 [Terriglobales bacterium]|nr:hypothetical protein [Terriglobales bacterium]
MEHKESPGISRRRLLAMAGVSAGTAMLAQRPLFADPGATSPAVNATASTKSTSFASLKQIDAGLLNVGYAEAGPAHGPAVILLQGWPYDIYSYVDVAPLLAAAGYRVIVFICVVSAARVFFPAKRFGMDNSRWLLSTSSR